LKVLHHFGGLPSEEQLEDYVREQLDKGMTIPGYGHAVLRTVDPRFTALANLAETYFPQDQLYRLVKRVYAVVPRVLSSLGKVKNPWPNVDAISGALLYHFGLRQLDFYTVLFGISRILGVTAQTVWSRGLYKPLERPKSITSQMLETMIAQADETAPAPLASAPVA
jgi:citrate synthase